MSNIDKEEINRLVNRYRILLDAGEVDNYNEAMTISSFIEPLFQALGWDIHNKEVKNEVTQEEQISKGRVDRAFRINDIPVFMLEAKQLSEDIDKWKFAEQAINYSWNKGVSWAVLTDFESIKIFNSEIPPKGLLENLFLEIKWHEYLDRLEELSLLSKSSFIEHKLDLLAEKYNKKIKRKAVGDSLFSDFLTWRDKLKKAINHQNKLSKESLEESVQRLLDRMVFMKTAEDRGLEEGTLVQLIRDERYSKIGYEIFETLKDKFRSLDVVYNSKLFSKHTVDDVKILNRDISEVISGFFTSGDGYSYDFSIISSDILGGVYEQYLSSINSNKETGTNKRREEGIYYTPSYISNFMSNTCLKLSKIIDIDTIKILDMSCGSGSFLISAFDGLLQAKKQKGKQLGLIDAHSILENNIYGIDLDSSAVEVCQLNLLLRAMMTRGLLPNLKNNLICGNSILENGSLHQKPLGLRNAFVLNNSKNSDFDIIIGNPPYIKQYVNKKAFNGLEKSPYYQGKMDIWTIFASVGIDNLRDNGVLAFIAPNQWLSNPGASKFRQKLFTSGKIIKIIDFVDYKVFKKHGGRKKEVGIQTMILFFRKCKVESEYKFPFYRIIDDSSTELAVSKDLNSITSNAISTRLFESKEVTIAPSSDSTKPISVSSEFESTIIDKMSQLKNFEFTKKESSQGIIGGPDEAFLFKSKDGMDDYEKKETHRYYTSCGKQQFGKSKHFISYVSDSFQITKSQAIRKQLENYKEILEKRREVKKGSIKWWRLWWQREERFFQKGPKIVSQRKTKAPAFLFTTEEYYGSASLYYFKSDRVNLKYLSAVLNSNLSKYWFSKKKRVGRLYQVDFSFLKQFPFVVPKDKTIETKVCSLVDEIISLGKLLVNLETNSDEIERLNRSTNSKLKEIDEIIYSIYKISSDEITTINESLEKF